MPRRTQSFPVSERTFVRVARAALTERYTAHRHHQTELGPGGGRHMRLGGDDPLHHSRGNPFLPADQVADEKEDRWDTGTQYIRIARRRSRSRSRSSSSSPRDDDDEDEFAASRYSFAPMYTASTPLSNTVSAGTSASGDESDGGSDPDRPHHIAPKAGRAPPLACHVFESRYTGDGSLDGHHAAELSVVLDTSVRPRPLFRWIHLTEHGSTLDFEHFSNEVSRIDKLSTAERNTVSLILRRVRRESLFPVQSPNGRDVHQMKPTCTWKDIPTDDPDAGPGNRRLMFLALPFFSLGPYAGLDAGLKSPSAVPAPTLLQSQFSHVDKKRDLQQAICYEVGTQEDLCLHISQLWCLVLDNSLLVTYTTVPESSLAGNYVTKTIASLGALVGMPATKKILVRYGDAVMWSIPLDECRSWFTLMTHFREFWTSRPELLYLGRKISPNDWPSLLDRAGRGRTNLELHLRLAGVQPSSPQRGWLPLRTPPLAAGEDQTAEEHESPVPREPQVTQRADNTPSETFSVFACLPGASQAGSERVDFGVITRHLEQVDCYLRHLTTLRDVHAYKSCSECSRASVRQSLEDRAARLSTAESTDDGDDWREQHSLEDGAHLFNVADTIFNFFLPAGFEGPTVNKYWGAINAIILASAASPARHSRDEQSHVGSTRRKLMWIASSLTSLNQLLSHARGDDRVKIAVPKEMTYAWIRLVLGLVHVGGDGEHSHNLIRFAAEALDKGTVGVLRSLSCESILTKSCILPLEVFTLISLNRIQQISVADNCRSEVEESKRDIAQIYQARLDKIKRDIAEKYSDRENERHLNRVADEIDAIRQTLSDQCDVLETISRLPYGHVDGEGLAEWPGRYLNIINMADQASYSKLQPTDPCGYRGLLVYDCLLKLGELDVEFKQVSSWCSKLIEDNKHEVATTQFRKDNAVYAFTIVTVIFLPLSAVSSIFGMNTSDIRDMEDGQWLYWATAVPVTVVVVLAALLWTGELWNFFHWIPWFIDRHWRVRQQPEPKGGATNTVRFRGNDEVVTVDREPPSRHEM